MQIIMKSCKSVELYAKEGGVDLQHLPTFAYSPTLLPLFIIWQIMKSGKSVKLYANVGRGLVKGPLAKVAKV